MVHQLCAIARHDEFLAEAQRSRLIAQWNASRRRQQTGHRAWRAAVAGLPSRIMQMSWVFEAARSAWKGSVSGQQGI
jgi:hypothetical protein